MESTPSQEPVKDEEKAKAAPKKMGLLKKIIYGVLIFYTLLFAFIRFWPPPQVDIEELKTFVSEDLSDSTPGISIDSVELKLIKEVHDKVLGGGHIDFAGSFEVTDPDGSKGEIAGTVTASYGLIWETYWDAFMREEELGPRMGRFEIKSLAQILGVDDGAVRRMFGGAAEGLAPELAGTACDANGGAYAHGPNIDEWVANVDTKSYQQKTLQCLMDSECIFLSD